MTAPSSPICTRCGEPINPGARFCMKCGSDVSGEQGSVATAMLPAAQERDAHEAMVEMLKAATIGEYEILRELGRGGMATVYLAHDIALDRKVAIKVMSPALLLMGEGMSERFKREARTAANLSHPHIIPIYTVKGSGKSLFFVMKFIAGRSLEAIIKDVGPMPVAMVKTILQQVGSALGYAHRHGVVHRDVKPANIMLDEEGWSVVTDFGIAKVAENRGLTMTGIAVGTPSYMSPEQCAAKDITGKSDQYSLGVVAYEMLTGKQPFEGDSAMAIMFAHFHEQPKPLLTVRPECPEDLAAAVMQMLEKAPDKRFGSMEEAVSAIRAQPLAHDDPTRLRLIEIVKMGSSSQILRQLTPPPTSPAPPAKTRQIVEQATTPIPAPKVVSVAVVPARNDLNVGDTMQLTATPRAAGGTAAGGRMEWKSADPAVASVSATGLVTALAPGTTSITATCDGVTGASQVQVTPVPVASVQVEPADAALSVGDDLTFRVTLRDQHGGSLVDRAIKWSATPGGLVTLGPAGEVKATREGVVEVKAECEGVRGSARVTVAPAPVAAVVVAPAEVSLRSGETASLEVTLTDREGRKLTGRPTTWRSSSEAVATVSAKGVVSGVAEGSVEITATVEGKQGMSRVRVAPAAVATIALGELRPVVPGERVQLSVTIKDARGQALTGRTVKWSSSSPAVATVTGDGALTAMGVGSARIIAESEGKSATATITVRPVPVTAVTIDGPADPLPVGGSVTLKATARDERGGALTGREVAWASSAAKVAGVNAQGVVSAKAPGETTISATVEGKRAEVRLNVLAPPKPVEAAVPPPVAEAPTEVLTTPKAKRQSTAAPAEARAETVPPRREVVPTPAPSGARGKIIGAGVGLLVLAAVGFAVLHKGAGPPAPIPPAPQLPQAPQAVASVTISGATGPLAVGRTAQFAVAMKDAAGNELNGRAVTWTSSDPTVAEVSPNGAVTGRKPGSATVTATAEGQSGTVALTVQAPTSDLPAAVASVSVSGGGKALEVGETAQLSATARDAKNTVLGDRTIVWSSGDPKVALVSSAGLVTAVGAGSATISASSEGKSGGARVTVNQPRPAAVASVTISPDAPTITTGATVQLTAGAFDERRNPLVDRPITWKSSDDRVARISDAGLVSGVAKGTVTITASVEGKSASARVTVNEVTVAVASVTLSAPTRSLKVGETAAWSATPRDSRGKELTDRAVSWSSSALAVASVSSSGVISGVGPGTAEIKVEVEGKSASERITVAAAPQPAPQPPAPQPPAPQPAPVVTTGGTDLPSRGVEAGGAIGCGIAQNSAVCWGAGSPGITPIDGTAGITQLSVGRTHACALLAGGRAVCWGDNRSGQLGGPGGGGTTAVPVSGDLSFSTISAGTGHTCGIAGGKAYCWGRGRQGQLGDGSGADRNRPVAVKSGQSFTAIAAGGTHTCAITGAGKAYCWGDGFSGQLGFGGQDQQLEPVDVSGDIKFTKIAAGDKHTCGLAAGGKAYCWGNNEDGEVGDGSTSDRGRPEAVSTGVIFSDISAGGNHTCGLSAGGEVYCWGENGTGQLGDGTKKSHDKPVRALGGQVYASISAGEGFTCAMTRGGEATCWGRNERGQLGDGGTKARGTPAPVRP
jgi:serine/threonine protein kinase